MDAPYSRAKDTFQFCLRHPRKRGADLDLSMIAVGISR
jgi:hypothetical protein